jgi:hypothetical protein
MKYTVARCATHFPLACEAIQVPGQGFDYPCAGDHMIARQLVLRIRHELWELFPNSVLNSTIITAHPSILHDIVTGNTYSDTVFCFADTAILLAKQSTFPS